ncbi:MAG TPA: NrfD/PsrC family molybdoenzyme membrane anchor subunit [Methylomirabilota bacterium]|nr:NrfD/PsrC family molybdoenzyme membrane anchor subunit [Methylomirabilota bacterium]
MPSTLFTAPPHWHWLVILYFFVGGLAGGCFFISSLIDLFGRPEDRPLARIGYCVAFPAVVLSGILLIADLGVPTRFWHMLLASHTGRPILKLYSPMSLGAWALLAFGAFAFAAFLAALHHAGRVRWPWAARFRPPGVVGVLVAMVGGLLGFFVAGYTGVLLSVTNRPIWSDTPLLGLNFLISAASTSAALMILLAPHRWWTLPGVLALKRFDVMVLALELIALVALVVSLGSMARAWLSVWGALLVVGVGIVGIVIPLTLHFLDGRRPGTGGARGRPFGRDVATALASVLVLVGGFVFRVVIVLSSEGIHL